MVNDILGKILPLKIMIRRQTRFEYVFTTFERAEIAKNLDILKVRNAKIIGTIAPCHKADWILHARIVATITQSCSVTLVPVVSRLSSDIVRRYSRHALSDLATDMTESAESEMPDDDGIEPICDILDLSSITHEAIALEMPAYPRAEDAQLSVSQFAGPNITPMSDEAAKPFAALATLCDSKVCVR